MASLQRRRGHKWRLLSSGRNGRSEGVGVVIEHNAAVGFALEGESSHRRSISLTLTHLLPLFGVGTAAIASEDRKSARYRQTTVRLP